MHTNTHTPILLTHQYTHFLNHTNTHTPNTPIHTLLNTPILLYQHTNTHTTNTLMYNTQTTYMYQQPIPTCTCTQPLTIHTQYQLPTHTNCSCTWVQFSKLCVKVHCIQVCKYVVVTRKAISCLSMVWETKFFFLADLNSPDSMLQIDIQFANYLPSSPSKEMMESLKFSFPNVFSCFFGYSYDLRLYTGNVMTHHI